MTRILAALSVLLLAFSGSSALAVKREILKQLRQDYTEHTYQLRSDLWGTNYLVISNRLNDEGIHHRGRGLAVLFYQLETIYLDRISNEGKRAVTLTLYRNREDAYKIRGAIPAAPMPYTPDLTTTMGSFARDLSTSITLEVEANKKDPAAQREQFIDLLNRLFYLKSMPTYDEKAAFVEDHPYLPIQKLMSLTELEEEVVRGIIKQRETK